MTVELGSLNLSGIFVVPDRLSVGEALRQSASTEASWAVLADSTNRAIAVTTLARLRTAFEENPGQTVSQLIEVLQPAAILSANTPALDALLWVRQQSMGPDDVIVVTRGARPVGVLTVENLLHADIGTEYRSNQQLPGPIRDPGRISRSCQYRRGLRLCGDRREFDSRPPALPQCLDPKGLGPHIFDW